MSKSSESLMGRVVVNFGVRCLVEDNTGQLLACHVPRKLEQPVCGDQVYWQSHGNQALGTVVEILPRRNELRRHDLRTRNRVLAANLDLVLVTLSPSPAPDLALVDRYLVGTEVLGLRPVLVFNKADLLDDPTSRQWKKNMQEYVDLGYPLIWASTKTHHGLEQLQGLLEDKAGIVVGQSGVGKSSLVDALVPDLSLKTQSLSLASGEGQHTTTATRLYPLAGGRGCIVDSPGVRDFRLWPMPAAELARGFPEIRPHTRQCHFQDCSHVHEPGCAVKQQLALGTISARRYSSYCQLVEWSAVQGPAH